MGLRIFLGLHSLMGWGIGLPFLRGIFEELESFFEPCCRGHFVPDFWNLKELNVGKAFCAISFFEDDVGVCSVEILIGRYEHMACCAFGEFENRVIGNVLRGVGFFSVSRGKIGVEVNAHERNGAAEHIGPSDTEHAGNSAPSRESGSVDAVPVDIEFLAYFRVDGYRHSNAVKDVARISATVCSGEDDSFVGEDIEPVFGKSRRIGGGNPDEEAVRLRGRVGFWQVKGDRFFFGSEGGGIFDGVQSGFDFVRIGLWGA